MYIKIFVVFGILRITIACHPVIFQKDNSVIPTEHTKASIPQHKNIPVNCPYYEVVTKTHLIRPTKLPGTLSTDRIPSDLVEIAATKLGIKNLDKIPSLSELSNLLGIKSREETIETIRQLTGTESGIDLIKAFIESSDYTDVKTDKDEQIQIEADTLNPPTIFLSETTQKDLEILNTVLSAPQEDLGFFQRVSSYLNIFDLFPENKKIPLSTNENEVDHIKGKLEKKHNESHHQHHSKLQPISVANSFPNSFPVSYRSGAPSPTLAPSTHRAMKEDQHFPNLKTRQIIN